MGWPCFFSIAGKCASRLLSRGAIRTSLETGSRLFVVRYIVYVIDSQTNTASGNEMDAIDAFNDDLERNGHWVMAAGIGSPKTAILIDNRDSAGLETSGSLFSNDDFYSGFWIIECANDDDARAIAARGSKACNRRVELRPFLR